LSLLACCTSSVMPVLLGPVDQASVMPGTMLVCRLLHRGAGDALFAPV
jgi:hypothetical protein